MNRTVILCLLCAFGFPVFASATEEDSTLVLEDAFTRYVGLIKDDVKLADQEALQTLKCTFQAFAARQDLGEKSTLDATLALGLMALFGGPDPRDYRQAWQHFETIRKSDTAPLDMRNKAATFMVILLTRGHTPQNTCPRQKLLMLMSVHTITDAVRERVRAFLAVHKPVFPSVASAPAFAPEEFSDWEDSPDHSRASSNDSLGSKEGDGESSDTPSTSARTRPYTDCCPHRRQHNKRQRR